jgi:hypothetical protein
MTRLYGDIQYWNSFLKKTREQLIKSPRVIKKVLSFQRKYLSEEQ